MKKETAVILEEMREYYIGQVDTLRIALETCPVNPVVVQRLKTEKRMILMFLDDLNHIG